MQHVNRNRPDKPPSRKSRKREEPSILWHFESMDRVNRALQGINDLEQVMKDVLDTLLSVFECDRAWLVYPCDPESPSWQVPMERSRPEYPGLLPIGVELPLDPVGAEIYRILRSTDGPVKFGVGEEHPVPMEIAVAFKVQSFIAMAFYPKIGKPWSFGLHQCSHARIWKPEEERLFKEIGRRISDTLTSLLMYRNLQENEKQIKQLIDASPVAMIISSGLEEKVEWVNDKFIELFGYTVEDIPDVEHWWPLAYPDETYRARIRAQWEESARQAIRDKGEIQPMEATVRCKDGSRRHIEFRLSSIGEKHLVIFVDLTERKRAEEKLLTSEHKYREIFENVSDALFLLEVTEDGHFRNMEINRAFEESTGFSRDQLLGKIIEEVVPQETANIVNAKYRRCVEAGTIVDEEVELDLPTGTRAYHSSLIPIRDDKGRVYRIIGITRDITESKKAAAQVLASEQLFRALVENSPDFIARYDREFRRIYVNPAIQKLFKVPAENVLGKTPSEQSPVYAPEVYIDHLRHVIETSTETATEMPYRTAEGEIHWGHMRFVPEFGPDGSVDSVLAIGRDIQEIKENESRFRKLAENFPDLVMRFDRQGRYLYVSPAFEKVFAMPADAVVGKTLQELPPRIKPEQSDISLEQIRRAFEEGVANDAEVRWETEAGERIFENRHVPEKDAAGSVVTVLCIARDVTERKHMTEALAAREREFRTLAEHSPDNIARYDVNCRTIYVNPTLERTLRRPASEMLGTLPAEVEFIKEGKEFQQKMVEVLKTGKEQEMDVVLPDMGEGVRYHNIRFVAERGADGAVTGIQAIGRDLTERKLAEMALSRERELLRTLVDNLPEEVYVKDRERRFLFVNELLVRALGAQSMDEVIGKRDEDFWPPYLAKQFADEENKLMRTGKPLLNDEHTPPHKSGPKRWLLRTKLPLRDGAGNIIGLAGLGRDITERKQAEQAVRESEERLRQIASSLREVVWLRDAKTRQVLYVNPAFQELTGRTCESFYENRDLLRDAIHPDDRKDVTKALEKRSQSVPFASEHRIIHLNGSVRWVSSKSFAVRNEAGEVYRWASVMEDITERKLAAEALRESEEKYRLLHENAGVGIGYYKPDGEIISYNQLAASRMRGKPEDFEGKSIYDVFSRAEAEFYMGRIRKSLETQSTLEYEDHLELPSGEKWFLSIFTKISDAQQNVIGVQIISQDITEQKQAEAALRESERRLVAAQRMAHVGYWERDFDSNRVTLSDEACRIFGIAEQGLSLNLNEWHQRWVALIHPDDQPRLIELLGDVLAGILSYDVEYRVIRPDGAVRFIYSQAEVQRDASGHAHNMLGMMQDITERKQAELALRASENRFRVLSENAFVGIYIIQDGRLSYCNSTQAKIFGYTPEELIGTDPRLLVHPDDQAMVVENIRRRIDGEIETIHYEFRGRCKDGSIKNIEVLGGRIDFSGKTAVIGNLMDITDRKRAENEIARSLDAEKKARKVAEILREANESLSRTLHLDDVLQNLLLYLRHLVPYDSANVMLLEGDLQLRVVALRGYEHWTDLDAARKLVFDIREIPSLNEVITTQKSIMVTNTYKYPGWVRVTGTEHIVSWLGIPIIADGQVIGLYSVDKVEPDFFTDEHRLLAEGLAAQAAVAIQNTRLHDQITRANVELEQRVFDRTAQLEGANQELEAFAYSISHDLRAPLRHVDGFIELLQKRVKSDIDEKSQHYMEVIADSAKQMGQLIDDLLSFSRMGRSEMITDHVDLGKLLDEIRLQLKADPEYRSVAWNIAPLPSVRGDRSMLKIVFTNLLSNSLKFTRSREHPQIEIGSFQDLNEVVVFVRDNGVGFDMKYADKLFGVFQRLHRQEDFEGTGIGLANVRRIINRHGGRTWAEGAVDRGATFYFSLPLSK